MNDTGKAFVPESQESDNADKEIQQHYSNGGAHVGSTPYTFQPYSGGGYSYWCEAPPLSNLSDPVWLIIRKNDATGAMLYAGTGKFDQLATDLATVAALTYTLGA